MNLTSASAEERFITTGRRASTMGDKSPKAREKSRKQDLAGKQQKEAIARAKLPLSAAPAGKKPR
jgi:hypothetical protein